MHASHDTPRERRHHATLERLLDAAMEMVVEGGLDALSVNQLAARLDYTPGALYRYVASKDALIALLLRRVLAELREVLAVEGPPLARLLGAVQAYRAWAEAAPQQAGMLAAAIADPRVLVPDPEQAAGVLTELVITLQPVAAAFAEAAATGALSPGDPQRRTLLFFASVQGTLALAKQRRHAPELVDLPSMTAEVARALLVGWGADPKELP